MDANPGASADIRIGHGTCNRLDESETREWLLSDGLGGYASGTIAGSPTRRYHGLLFDAVTPPTGRYLLLHSIQERVMLGEESFELATNRWSDGTIAPRGYEHLEEFHLEGRTPTWTWCLHGVTIQRRIALCHRTVQVHWSIGESEHPVHLQYSVLVSNRSHHGLYQAGERTPTTTVQGTDATIQWPFGPAPTLEISTEGTVMSRGSWWRGFHLAEEAARGFPCTEDAWEALEGQLVVSPERGASLHAGVDRDSVRARPDLVGAARRDDQASLARAGVASVDSIPGRLVIAANQFIVDREHPDGTTGKTLIAGYPWFTDWGRDTMLSLPGLVLGTGQPEIAESILTTFAAHEHRGLIPNVFSDDGTPPKYNTVDAPLLFIEAVRRWHEVVGEPKRLAGFWPTIRSIITHYTEGTLHGIGMDDSDGLVHAGEPGLQLTWMDARVGEQVITPRRGKPVEINAFWYAALRTAAEFAALLGEDASGYTTAADRVKTSFGRFWNPHANCLFDVIDGPDGDDHAVRPNQILAIGTASDLVDSRQGLSILQRCRAHLVVPMGIRSLSPECSGFTPQYVGSPEERDGAYHQGTAWPWLLDSYVKACRSILGPDTAQPLIDELTNQLRTHLREAGVGSVSEILDAIAPNRPRGCFAQAWSVAAMLDIHRMGAGRSTTTENTSNERRAKTTSGVR
ncbi:MAG: amylo-alpha-1,6-glucosidase [Planctomycetota bacterium]|nr:amylo-alpha-1,6-glucosidase [Planctomycetota bacterium]